MLKFLLALIFLLLLPGSLRAQRGPYIDPHIRIDGTYVPGHYRYSNGGNIYIQTHEVLRTNPTNTNPFTGEGDFRNLYSNYNINQWGVSGSCLYCVMPLSP